MGKKNGSNGGEWAVEPKKELTPREALMVAHAHLICGIDQHKLASMYGVNQGRINEAVSVMRKAAENHREIHQERMSRKRKAKGEAHEGQQSVDVDGV